MDVRLRRKKPAGKSTRIQEVNRRIILDAALEVFSTYGFRGSTIDQIADRAGMSKPNLLYYFKRKQDIYVSVLEDTLADWLQPLADMDPLGDPVTELQRYIARKLAMSAARPEASRLFANEILQGAPAIQKFLRTTLKDLVDEKAAVLHRWMTDGRIAAVDPHHLIFMIWAMTQHYADFETQVRAIIGPEADSTAFRQTAGQAITTLLLDGLKRR
jgi:TetR/AcrR family transcriptional regulator